MSTDLDVYFIIRFAFFTVYDPSKCGVFPSFFPLGEAGVFTGERFLKQPRHMGYQH